jgi:hypothetical protein
MKRITGSAHSKTIWFGAIVIFLRTVTSESIEEKGINVANKKIEKEEAEQAEEVK